MQDASLNPFASGLLPQAGAQIAISIEPLDQVVQLSADQSAEATTKDVVSLVTSKLLENFSEYAASFAITQAQMIPAPNEMFIPVSALNRWVAKIERRLAEDPNFWRT